MIVIIYNIITLSLDNFFNNVLPYSYNNLSIFYSMLMISSLIINYLLLNDKKKFIFVSIILGFITDILYSNIPINIFVFLLLGLFIIRFFNHKKINIFNILLCNIILIIIYDSLLFLCILLSTNNFYTMFDLYYKIYHSLLLNTIFIIISYFILFSHKKSNKKEKYKKYNSYI